MGELQGVFCEDFSENLPNYNGILCSVCAKVL